LTFDQIVYRSHITAEKLEKTSARDLEIMRSVAYDKERLERDQSTENIGLVIYERIMEAKRRIAAEEEERKAKREGKAETN